MKIHMENLKKHFEMVLISRWLSTLRSKDNYEQNAEILAYDVENGQYEPMGVDYFHTGKDARYTKEQITNAILSVPGVKSVSILAPNIVARVPRYVPAKALIEWEPEKIQLHEKYMLNYESRPHPEICRRCQLHRYCTSCTYISK